MNQSMDRPEVDQMTEEQIQEALTHEWMGVLEPLWTAIGKPVEAARLKVYKDVLGVIPLGVLEQAVKRALRENTYSQVPPPGEVWKAAMSELGDPSDAEIEQAVDRWLCRRWGKVTQLRDGG